MNVEPLLLALQAAFLILLYVFIWRVVRSAGRDMQVAPPQESFILAPSQMAAEHAVADPGRLVVERSNAVPVGKTFDAGPVPVTLGRSSENTIPLDGDEFASGHHARIESQRDGVWILDLGSTNGTFVNGERVEGRRLLHRGDLLQIGDTDIRFER
jgi:pSer/pThr/pTyr-binding forkhead associated (FHA) protein